MKKKNTYEVVHTTPINVSNIERKWQSAKAAAYLQAK